MSTGHILLLGPIAGATIFLGLPSRGSTRSRPVARAGLSALATGILLFLFWDVLTGAVDPIDAALHARALGAFARLSALGAPGFAVGLMGLVYYAVWMRRRSSRRVTTMVGPGAAAVDEFAHRRWIDELTPGKQLSLLIAVGIGVHNFGEGLAIGQAAAAGHDEPRRHADHRLRAAQRDGRLRHLRAARRRGHEAELEVPRPHGADRRRADVPRHRARAGVVERGDVGRLLRDRRGLDPLRRAGAHGRQPELRAHRRS